MVVRVNPCATPRSPLLTEGHATSRTSSKIAVWHFRNKKRRKHTTPTKRPPTGGFFYVYIALFETFLFQPVTGDNTSAIRVVTIDGNPWFVAADVGRILEIINITDRLKSKYIGEDEKAINFIGNIQFNLISESALYKLTMRSSSENAKPFQDWVTKTVLPAIRKEDSWKPHRSTKEPVWHESKLKRH